MKKLSLMATLVAFLVALGIARADKDDDKSGTDIRVETKVSGEVMTVGPDGEVKVEKFGDDGKMEGVGSKMEGVESLPKSIQELLKQGKLGAGSVGGSITIVGADGKEHTHSLGDGKLDEESISKSIEKALKGTGMIAPGIAQADKDDDKNGIDIRVETKVSGEVITVGPDGKVKVEKFGPDGKMEGVGSLPKNIQELLKKGKLGAGSVGGSITIVGPDGKEHTHSLGDGKLDAESISKSIEKALEGTGKELPKEVQDQLKEALKDLPKALSFQMGRSQSSGEESITEKLDEILKRLNKLEKEVRDLKASHQ